MCDWVYHYIEAVCDWAYHYIEAVCDWAYHYIETVCDWSFHYIEAVCDWAFQAGEGAWGTEEAEINAILCLRSPGQLLRIIEKYELLKDGVTIEDAIRSECSGTLQEGYLAIGKLVIDLVSHNS